MVENRLPTRARPKPVVCRFDQSECWPELAAKLLGIERSYFGSCTTIQVVRGGTVLAIAVYSSFNGVNCELTIAAGHHDYLRPHVRSVLFRYPFSQLGCRRVTVLVAQSNAKTIQLAKRLGFVQEGRLRSFLTNGEDCVVLGLLRSEWEHGLESGKL